LEAINEVLIEKVFTSSGNLSDSGIIYFVDCLVRVSETEIDGGDSKKVISGVGRSVSTSDHPDSSADGKIRTDIEHDNGPRIFSLQKVVEVADYNMNIRSRLSWAKIWKLMAKHLVKIGCNENARVSMFAIDALRQLSHKFLEKAELADFNFQKLFLRPFLSIMENTQSREDIRELIIQSVDKTMRSMSRTLRSGWKIFFSILTLSAQDPSLKINTFGLTILQRLLDEHLHEFCKGGGTHEESEGMSVSEIKERNRNTEDFIALTRASLAFIESEKVFPVTVMMRALCHIACYADVIAEGKVLSPIINTQVSITSMMLELKRSISSFKNSVENR
jgi:brefeldin A-inhibited guanine nucleotide-exchange protein